MTQLSLPDPPPPSPKRKYGFAVILVIIGIAVYFCTEFHIRRSVLGSIEGDQITVCAPFSGTVRQTAATEGGTVRRGDILLRLHTGDIEKQLETTPEFPARGELAQVSSLEEELQIQLALARHEEKILTKAKEQAAMIRARAQLRRRELEGTDPASTPERAKAAEEKALKTWTALTARLEKVSLHRAACDRQLRQIKQQRIRLEQQQEYAGAVEKALRPGKKPSAALASLAELRSPADGTILSVAQPGTEILKGEPLVRLLNSGKESLRAEVYFTPEDARHIRTGEVCLLRGPDGLNFQGTVAEILPPVRADMPPAQLREKEIRNKTGTEQQPLIPMRLALTQLPEGIPLKTGSNVQCIIIQHPVSRLARIARFFF